MLDAERAVAAEADVLVRSIEGLCAEVQALTDRAARLQEAGYAEAEWLLVRFQSHRMQPPDLSGPSAQAVAARNSSPAAHARAVEMARRLLQASASALDEHRAGLARDTAELERIEAVAEARDAEARAAEARRAEAARKEAEQARARREAQAAAQRRASTPQPTPGTGPARARTVGQPLGKMSPPVAVGPGRSASRIPMQTQVDLTSDSNVFTGFSTNLSEGGLFVATVNLLPVGTPVDLTFSLPGNNRLTVKGEVRWTREIDDRVPDVFPGVGVRFVELATEVAQALHRFIAEREPLFYPD